MDDDLIKAIEAASVYESTVKEILTLAIEFEAKTITAERFANRVIEILHSNLQRYVPK